MRFIRALSVKHHPTGDHYSLAIPPQVAQAIGLDKEDGLVSLSVDEGGKVTLQAYKDSEIAWREKFDPSHHKSILRVPVPPRTLGPSKPWATGKVVDFRAFIRESRIVHKWLEAELKRIFPPRRGRRPRRRRW